MMGDDEIAAFCNCLLHHIVRYVKRNQHTGNFLVQAAELKPDFVAFLSYRFRSQLLHILNYRLTFDGHDSTSLISRNLDSNSVRFSSADSSSDLDSE
ncbi:hypothetical protein D3C73_1409380 [compost metagenome]